MLIGIMSDAHDSIQGVKDALRVFSQKKVDLVLFAGDMIGSGNCYTFEGFGIPLKLVYGNNDGDRVGLAREFARVGGEYLGDFGEIEADGLKIALMHGTEEPLVKAVVASQLYDVVVRGHNHRAEVTGKARRSWSILARSGPLHRPLQHRHPGHSPPCGGDDRTGPLQDLPGDHQRMTSGVFVPSLGCYLLVEWPGER